MYNRFIQFVIPRIGQGLIALVLYLNFLALPFLRPLTGMPVLFFGLPFLLLAVLVWVARDPLGVGLAAAAQLCGVYATGDLITLLAHLVDGPVWQVWRLAWQGGLLAWEVTAVLLLWGWRKAVKLCTTTYTLTTQKPLPGGRLRVVQLSDLHPGTGAMNRDRIPELYDRVAALHPDILVLTGDIFDEYISRQDFDAFCELFGRWQMPGGKWFVPGNHDFFHYWHTPSYTRQELEKQFDAAGVTWKTAGNWWPFPAGTPHRCGWWVARTGWIPRAGAWLPPNCSPAARTGCSPSGWTTSPGNCGMPPRPGRM